MSLAATESNMDRLAPREGRRRVPITDIHHFGLTVRDVEASCQWYENVLGFRRVGEYTAPDGERHKIFLAHDGLRARLGLCQHRSSTGTAFDETQIGLDHLAFAVSDRAELERWVVRLIEHGVEFSPIADSHSISGASVIVLRDPDNIQLELFADPAAP
jgi:glyoxylase I family protein